MIQTLVVEPSIARVSRHEWQHHDLVQLKRLINPKYSPHITMHTPIRMILYLWGGIKITVFINTKYVLYASFFLYNRDCFEFSCMIVIPLAICHHNSYMTRYVPKKINILCWQKVAMINWWSPYCVSVVVGNALMRMSCGWKGVYFYCFCMISEKMGLLLVSRLSI